MTVDMERCFLPWPWTFICDLDRQSWPT